MRFPLLVRAFSNSRLTSSPRRSSVKDAAAPAAALPSPVPASVPSSAAGSHRTIRTSKRSADTLDDDEVAEYVESVKIAPRKRTRYIALPSHSPPSFPFPFDSS